MSFNKYGVYSILSVNESKNTSSMENVLKEIEKLGNYKTAKSAKEYLKNTYNVSDGARSFYINGEVPVKLSESNSAFVVNVKIKDENISYCYKK